MKKQKQIQVHQIEFNFLLQSKFSHFQSVFRNILKESQTEVSVISF